LAIRSDQKIIRDLSSHCLARLFRYSVEGIGSSVEHECIGLIRQGLEGMSDLLEIDEDGGDDVRKASVLLLWKITEQMVQHCL
jgi:hypothetical protein